MDGGWRLEFCDDGVGELEFEGFPVLGLCGCADVFGSELVGFELLLLSGRWDRGLVHVENRD